MILIGFGEGKTHHCFREWQELFVLPSLNWEKNLALKINNLRVLRVSVDTVTPLQRTMHFQKAKEKQGEEEEEEEKFVEEEGEEEEKGRERGRQRKRKRRITIS